MTNPNPDTIRDAVLAELERLDWSRYQLVQLLRPSLASTIYGWLAGTRRVVDSTASEVLDVLDLDIKNPTAL